MEDKIKKLIFAELGINEDIDTTLLNTRSHLIKKYSKLNNLIDIVNTIKEEKNIKKLEQILSELQTLNKENKLDKIRDIDLKEELKEEYAKEYNLTSTRYGKLSDEELTRIEGIESFEYDGKKFIILNGAPFRFLGRTIFGNGSKNLTSPDFTQEQYGSLITNIRPNRWASSEEFDIFDDLNSDNFTSFGAADAQKSVNADNQMISPEILQLCMSSKTGAGYHTTIGFKGNRSSSASFITLEKALDFDESKKWIPYDTVYVFNKESYISQAQKRSSYFEKINQPEIIKEFSETANPEIIYNLLTSSIKYYDNSCDMAHYIPQEVAVLISNWVQQINFDSCNEIENLRHINGIIEILKRTDSVHSNLLTEIGEKSASRLQKIAQTRNFSIADAVEKSTQELQSSMEYSPKEIMIEFIKSEIKKSKDKGIFVTSGNIKEQIIHQDENKKQLRDENAKKIKNQADKIRFRQEHIDKIYELLGLDNNQEDIYEIAYKLSEIAKKVSDDEKMPFKYSCEVSKRIIENDEFKQCLEEWKQEQTNMFMSAIQTKVQKLIQDADIEKLDEQIKSIETSKVGIIGRLFGQKKYYDAIKNNLQAQKSKISIDKIPSNHSIEYLIRYIKENGATQKIHNFLQQYYIYNLGISENEKQSIEKILEIPIRSKQNYSIERFSPMQYKAKTAQIENETRQILQESTEKPNYPKFKINAWKTHSLRTYVDQVNLFTNQGILKNKEKKEIDYDLRHN